MFPTVIGQFKFEKNISNLITSSEKWYMQITKRIMTSITSAHCKQWQNSWTMAGKRAIHFILLAGKLIYFVISVCDKIQKSLWQRTKVLSSPPLTCLQITHTECLIFWLPRRYMESWNRKHCPDFSRIVPCSTWS